MSIDNQSRFFMGQICSLLSNQQCQRHWRKLKAVTNVYYSQFLSELVSQITVSWDTSPEVNVWASAACFLSQVGYRSCLPTTASNRRRTTYNCC